MLPPQRQKEAVHRFRHLVSCHHPPAKAVVIVAREFGVSERSVYYFRKRSSSCSNLQ